MLKVRHLKAGVCITNVVQCIYEKIQTMTVVEMVNSEFADFIKLPDIPEDPGIYFFKNTSNEILYVGKAKNLRNRLRSYTDPNGPVKVREIVHNSSEVSYIVCPIDNYALLLESQFIIREKPKYNIKLKNTQGYPRISITEEKEASPSSLKVSWKDDINCYGPYPTIKADKIINAFLTVFPVRTCKDSVYKKHAKAKKMCELGDLGKCVGPCVGNAN